MSLLSIMRAKLHAWTSANPSSSVAGIIGNTPTTSGKVVTGSSALGVTTYFACLRAISEDVAKLPFIVYERLEPRGKKRLTNHPVYRVLHDQGNEYMSAMSVRETVTHFALGWGDGYAEIVYDKRGNLQGLYPIHPTRVVIKVAGGKPLYQVRCDDGRAVELDPERMFHLHGLGPDGLSGYSLLRYGAETLGLSMATKSFGASFFGNGSHVSGVLSHPGKVTPEAMENLRRTWSNTYQGTNNANKAAILEQGMTWTRIGIPPEESQFLETNRFLVEDVCRLCRVPPQKVGHMEQAAGWSTLESFNINYVTESLDSWLKRWELEANRKLLNSSADSALFAEHLILGLLRGDSGARSAYYMAMNGMGAMTVNEIRAAENMDPVEGGDDGAWSRSSGNVALRGVISGETRDNITQAHIPLLRSVIERIERIETKEAVKKGDSIYAEQSDRFRSAIIPPIEALAGSLRATYEGEIMAATWDSTLVMLAKHAAEQHAAEHKTSPEALANEVDRVVDSLFVVGSD